MTFLVDSLLSTVGIYAGAAGYVSYGGVLDMCIAIRTLVIKDGTAYLQAGRGKLKEIVTHLKSLHTRSCSVEEISLYVRV